jgi:hypothetical protein
MASAAHDDFMAVGCVGHIPVKTHENYSAAFPARSLSQVKREGAFNSIWT